MVYTRDRDARFSVVEVQSRVNIQSSSITLVSPLDGGGKAKRRKTPTPNPKCLLEKPFH